MSLREYIPGDPAQRHVWYPINAQQQTAMRCKAEMLLYGGGSGGGKTDFLVADAAQERDNRNLRAIIIRKAFSEMPQILDRTREVYSQMGATYRGDDHCWRFPSGAHIRLCYLRESGGIANFQGNPFSYLGVDESTYFTERGVRDLLPWHAVTDASLFHRIRLCTNPGQIGAPWHMHIFLNNKCPSHFPEESLKPYQIYADSEWMDGVPTKLTTCFIPSLAADNPLYGQQKQDRLDSQTAEIREKLKLGCWCTLEGAYFRFLRPRFRLPYSHAAEQWWHKHLIAVDYGFMGSWAAAGLYSVSEPSADWPEGRMFQIGELAENQMGSEDFASLIGRAFIAPQLEGRRREFEYAIFDPANDAQTGNGRSNFDIMREVIEGEYGVMCIKAAKGAGSRISNAQNLYRLLKTGPLDKPEEWNPGQLVITDLAPITFSSLCSRMNDPHHPGAVLKVENDKKDDLYDQLAYVASQYFNGSEAPHDISVQQTLRQYREAGMDEHSLNIYESKMRRDAGEQDKPISLGRSRSLPRIRR